MELRTWLDAFPKKAVEDRRRSRSVETSVVKAQSNFDRVRHSPPSPHSTAKYKSRSKALKDGRDWQECQDEKEGQRTNKEERMVWRRGEGGLWQERRQNMRGMPIALERLPY